MLLQNNGLTYAVVLAQTLNTKIIWSFQLKVQNMFSPLSENSLENDMEIMKYFKT